MSKDMKVNTTPEKPENPFFLWAGIILGGSGSLFFNHAHDVHSLGNNYLAVIAGILPPILAAIVPHALKHVDDGWMPYAVFAGSIGAMVVSAKGTAVVLTPAYGPFIAWGYSLVLDGISLTCLYALTSHYQKVFAYKKWLKAQKARSQQTETVPPAPATRNHHAAPSGTNRLVPAGTGTSAPVGTNTAVVPPVISAANGTGPRPAGERHHPPVTRARRTADPELREQVVREFAVTHPRPGAESLEHRRVRAEKFLTEFRERTGERANNHELAKALQVHPKRDIPEIRAGITEPEGERGEETG